MLNIGQLIPFFRNYFKNMSERKVVNYIILINYIIIFFILINYIKKLYYILFIDHVKHWTINSIFL